MSALVVSQRHWCPLFKLGRTAAAPDNAEMPTDSQHDALATYSVPDLFALAVANERRFGGVEERAPATWEASCELQRRGTQDVQRAAADALSSADRVDRIVGAEVLGELGWREGGTLVEESVAMLVEAARGERDASVLRAIATALGRRPSTSGRHTLFDLATHPSPAVRLAVAQALQGASILSNDDGDDDDPAAVKVLIDLMRDHDADVRNWATFALGTQLTADGPEIRAALRERLEDEDDETREEGVCGLANRRDEVAFEPLMEYLASGLAGSGCIRAAEEWGDPRFVDVLAEADAALQARIRAEAAEEPTPSQSHDL